MSMFFFILAMILGIAAFGTILVGVTVMGRGGGFNEKYGNKLMRLRVILQGLALAALVLCVISR